MQMQAAVCYEFGKPLTVESLTVAPPAAGEVLVKIAACAICHSDLAYINGDWGGDLPQVFGHEAAGVVAAVGAGVARATVGMPVLVTLLRSCGYCGYCESGRPNICQTKFPLDAEPRLHNAAGAAIKPGLRTGAFAEYAVVEQSQVVEIPADLPMAVASLLSCGVITGFGAVVNTAQMPAGARAGVIGCGGVGLNSVQAAAYCSAYPVVAVDLAESKLAVARQFGATHTLRPSADLRAAVEQIAPGGLDYVFVAAGVSRAIANGLELLAPGGVLTILGMPADGDLVGVDAAELAGLNQRILGSKMGSTRLRSDIPKLIRMYQHGQLKLDELITRRYPLRDINRAIAEVRADEVLRNVVVME